MGSIHSGETMIPHAHSTSKQTNKNIGENKQKDGKSAHFSIFLQVFLAKLCLSSPPERRVHEADAIFCSSLSLQSPSRLGT